MASAFLKQGICSWTDAELIRRHIRLVIFLLTISAANSFLLLQQLPKTGKFPCVEVDMSTYVIPNQVTCEKWAKNTVPGFVFHFKIFQFFTSQVIDVPVLPLSIQQKLSPAIKSKGKLTWDETSNEMRDELWNMYNEAIRPVHKMGKLGVVLFQFQPCDRTRKYLQECRARLAPEYIMAVEFRNLDWFNVENLPATIAFCEHHRLVLTCVDELLEARNRQAQPSFQLASSLLASSLLEPGAPREQKQLAPRSEIILEVTNPACVYIRVHRRSGDHRLLSDQELTAWADRLRRLIDSGRVTGQVYMTWNTHHENQAILNPIALAAKIPSLCYDWKTHVTAQPGRLDSFFARKPAAAPSQQPLSAPTPAAPPPAAAAVVSSSAPSSSSKPPSPDIIEIIEYDDDPEMIGFYTSPKNKANTPSPKKHGLTEKEKAPAAKKARAQKPAAPDAAMAKQQMKLASFFFKSA